MQYKLVGQLEIQGISSVLDKCDTLLKELNKQEEGVDPITYPLKLAKNTGVKTLSEIVGVI